MMLALLLATALGIPAEAPQEAQPPTTTYQMVLLKKGPSQPPSSAEAQKQMQDEHLAGLAELNRKRVNLIYGPILTEGDLKGIAVLAVPSAEDARQAFANDPFVRAGVMSAEVRPWRGPTDFFQVPPSYDVSNPSNLEPLIFGLLVAGPAAAQATADQIQQGHLAYLDSLRKQGKLAFAGPFADDGPARGVVVYRVKDVAAARALAAEDPAVIAGRLTLEAYPWMTFRGILKP
jgi:uncharacterized protein YciI